MKGKKDQFEHMITEDFEQLAKEEEEEILKDDSIQMPEGFKESLRQNWKSRSRRRKEKNYTLSYQRKTGLH